MELVVGFDRYVWSRVLGIRVCGYRLGAFWVVRDKFFEDRSLVFGFRDCLGKYDFLVWSFSGFIVYI